MEIYVTNIDIYAEELFKIFEKIYSEDYELLIKTGADETESKKQSLDTIFIAFYMYYCQKMGIDFDSLPENVSYSFSQNKGIKLLYSNMDT